MNYRNLTGSCDPSVSIKEDWFDGNITDFQINSPNANNYVVIRKITIYGHSDFFVFQFREARDVRI